MLIERDGEVAAAQLESSCAQATCRDYFGDAGIAFENRGKSRFHQHGNSQIGPPGFHSRDHRSFENQIAKRAQSNDQNLGAVGQTGEQGGRVALSERLLRDRGLVLIHCGMRQIIRRQYALRQSA